MLWCGMCCKPLCSRYWRAPPCDFSAAQNYHTKSLFRLCLTLRSMNVAMLKYLFDEPSTGLHDLDIMGLLVVFQALLQDGHTILFIEHNNTLIQAANQVIMLGPGSGDSGGELVLKI